MSNTLPQLTSLVLILAVSACGSGTAVTAGQRTTTDSPTSPTSGQPTEPMTPGGIAVLVEQHLGGDRVRRYTTYDSDEGSVNVAVHLVGAGRRDMFVVNVYSPDESEAIGPGQGCEPQASPTREPGDGRCEELPDGSVVSVTKSGSGFSDNNEHGSVLMASALNPGQRMALAMYESYTQTIPVSQERLMDLMSDPRLAWLTDPALNEAGQDIAVTSQG